MMNGHVLEPSSLAHRASDLGPLLDMTPEQKKLVGEFLGLEESILSVRFDALAREMADLRREFGELRTSLLGQVSQVKEELSDTQKTNLVAKFEESQRELDATRRKLGIKERKTDEWRNWAWKVVIAIALGMLARHVLGILFPHIGG